MLSFSPLYPIAGGKPHVPMHGQDAHATSLNQPLAPFAAEFVVVVQRVDRQLAQQTH